MREGVSYNNVSAPKKVASNSCFLSKIEGIFSNLLKLTIYTYPHEYTFHMEACKYVYDGVSIFHITFHRSFIFNGGVVVLRIFHNLLGLSTNSL